MRRRDLLVVGFSFLLASCAAAGRRSGARTRLSQDDAVALVKAAPPGRSRKVALAVMSNKDTAFRYDNHGLPAWRWRDSRGNSGYGACVHIHPESGLPYLETQYAKKDRPPEPVSPTGNQAEKYIQFGLRGPWYSRVHRMFPREWEENWTNKHSRKNGEYLLTKLDNLIE